MESIEVKKVPLKKIADVAMRGINSIAILPHKPEQMEDIEDALLKFNSEFNPRCDAKSGLIMVSVPKAKEDLVRYSYSNFHQQPDLCSNLDSDCLVLSSLSAGTVFWQPHKQATRS